MGKNDFVFCRSVVWKSTAYIYRLNLFGWKIENSVESPPATHAGIATPLLVMHQPFATI